MGQSDFTTRELRDALSGFATGVTIVTARDCHGEAVGMTASSFNSVSMDPPLVLWSVTKTALSAPAFHAAKHFAIHVLRSDQAELSNRFARQGEDKFGGLDLEYNAKNVPLLDGCITRFECDTWAVYEGGDHWIIVGEVTALTKQNGQGLVFAAGSYATATPLLMENGNEQHSAPQKTCDDALEGLLIYQLSHAYHRLSDEFYRSVYDAGLSIPEWRILASLHTSAERSLAELSLRTFVEQPALPNMLTSLAEEGLCTFSGATAKGTNKGRAIAEKLFQIVSDLEVSALPSDNQQSKDERLATLMQTLKALKKD